MDGRVLKTPMRRPLELLSQDVAEVVADEWRSQGEHIKPKEMPCTTIGCTTIDRVQHEEPEASVARMMPFLEMDTLCFEDDDTLLAEQQRREWGPVRSWFEQHFGVVLATARGLGAPAHPEETLSSVAIALSGRSPWELCALEIAVSSAKSLIVGTALLERADVTAEDALRWALLEEHFQIERWGMVEGEHDVAHAEIRLWLEAAKLFGRGLAMGRLNPMLPYVDSKLLYNGRGTV